MSHTKPNTLPDELLVRRVLEGDRRAFIQIINQTEALVWQMLCNMIRNPEDRKDLFQEVYMKVYDKLSGFRFQSKMSTWIGQITYNTCLNWISKKKLVLVPDAADVEDGRWAMRSGSGEEADRNMLQKERLAAVREQLDRLPPLYQTLISLYHIHEASYHDMAQITGLPEGTVKSYLFRARKMLHDKLAARYKKDEL